MNEKEAKIMAVEMMRAELCGCGGICTDCKAISARQAELTIEEMDNVRAWGEYLQTFKEEGNNHCPK